MSHSHSHASDHGGDGVLRSGDCAMWWGGVASEMVETGEKRLTKIINTAKKFIHPGHIKVNDENRLFSSL